MDTYFVVHKWMVDKLGLKTIERDVFAIIYGYSQDGDSDYHGSLQYLADITGYSRNSVCTALKSLVDKNYLLKHEDIINNIKFCKYVANLDTVQALCTPVQALCTNNINIIKNDNKILSKDNIASEIEFDFGISEKPKKPNLYTKCLDIIDEWTNLPKIQLLLKQYLDVCMEMKCIKGANQWKGMLNTLEKVQMKCHPHTFEEIIENSINHGWKTFYPIDDNFKGKPSEFMHIKKNNDNVTAEDLESSDIEY